MSWYNPWSWGNNDDNQLGTAGNPSNYNSGPNAGGFGGAGEIAGGGQVPMGSINMPYFDQDRGRLQQMMNGQSPFASQDWNGLITQLQARASGTAPSLAGMAYDKGLADTGSQLSAMSSGSASPAAAYAAQRQMGNLGEGQAAGYAMARTNEMNTAQQGLTSALGARDQLNQQAYLNILAQQLGLSTSQLQALKGDQSFTLGQAQTDQQRSAAAAGAVASLFGGAATLGTGGKKP